MPQGAELTSENVFPEKNVLVVFMLAYILILAIGINNALPMAISTPHGLGH